MRELLYPVGYLASALFGLRFAHQWWVSEKAGASVSTKWFWRLSLAANGILAFHSAVQLQAWICLIQSLQAVLAWRNLDLLGGTTRSVKVVFWLLAAAGLGAIAVCAAQGALLWPLHGLEFIGVVGVCAYSMRFWVQWWHAERHEPATFSPAFWWCSFAGAAMAIAYFSTIQDYVNLIGPVMALVPYFRNVQLSRRPTTPLDREAAFVFAGEQSAALYGEGVLQRMANLKWFGVGNEAMQRAGCELLLPMSRFSVMGISGVLRRLPQLLRDMRKLRRAIIERNPHLVLFIDAPSLSMRMARWLRRHGYRGKIVQLVAPTVWAYRPRRVDAMARDFDLLLTLFAFEPRYFTETGLKTVWVGHPIVEVVRNQMPTPLTGGPYIGIFPGSRHEEIARNLPLQLVAAEKLNLPIAVSVASEEVRPLIEECVPKGTLLVPGSRRYDLMRACKVAVVTSGTVTLELALHKVPAVVIYKLTRLNYFVARFLYNVRLPFYCIANIVAWKPLYSELYDREIKIDDVSERLCSAKPFPDDLKFDERLSPPGSPFDRIAEELARVL